MEYNSEIVEIKTSISTGDGGSVNKHGCMLEESTSVTLSDGRIVTVPEASTIHSGAIIGYTEYSHRMYLNDLTDYSNFNGEKITIKLKIETPILPHWVPQFIKEFLIKTSIIPYFSCDCWTGFTARTISIYGKERFERHNEMRQEFIKYSTERLSDGEFVKMRRFCPYYGDCISEFNEEIYISNTGEEFSELDVNLIKMDQYREKKEKEFSQRREDFLKMKKERKHLLNSTGRIDS